MDDAPFEALGMFPDSMHQLLSYENMLSGGALSCCGSEDLLNATLGVDAMDTCGFPLFSHDLQLQSAAPDLTLTLTPEDQVQLVCASGVWCCSRLDHARHCSV